MSQGDQTQPDSIETPIDALLVFDRIIQRNGKATIMTKEYAEDLIAGFESEGVSVDDFHFQKLKHMDRISENDELAIGYGDFAADLADALGLDADRPTFGGHGSTARARLNANFPKLVEYVGVEEQVETEVEV